jgi:hypothetical protein
VGGIRAGGHDAGAASRDDASDSTSEIAKTIRASIAKLDSLAGALPASGGGFAGVRWCSANAHPTFVQLVNVFLRQLGTFDNGDIAPTAAMLAAQKSACNDLGKSVAAWRAFNGADLSALNAALSKAGKTPVAKALECRRRLVGRMGGRKGRRSS